MVRQVVPQDHLNLISFYRVFEVQSVFNSPSNTCRHAKQNPLVFPEMLEDVVTDFKQYVQLCLQENGRHSNITFNANLMKFHSIRFFLLC